MAQSNTPLFRLPLPVKKQVITVKLSNGQVVKRSPDDLVELPAELRGELADFAPPVTQ
jgi:hypothetical protein